MKKQTIFHAIALYAICILYILLFIIWTKGYPEDLIIIQYIKAIFLIVYPWLILLYMYLYIPYGILKIITGYNWLCRKLNIPEED